LYFATVSAYLLGLLVGGGIIHGESLQIILPYKKWGSLSINPTRAGGIAEDILARLNPMWMAHYGMNVSYKVGTDWKIVSDKISKDLKDDLLAFGLPEQGELRYTSRLNNLIPLLTTIEHKKNFITGLVDTIGSLAASHRRFISDFQILSFEFKGSNFDLVGDVVKLMIDIGCTPDQVLWNHPNQHSGICRYYKSWKKGFKIRVALDDYMLKGSFVFKSKKLSAEENKDLQKSGTNTVDGKPIKISGRVTLHVDENSSWLPNNIRGGHFIHNLHFYEVLGMQVPVNFSMKKYIDNFADYFCPFTCLTKGSLLEIEEIIKKEDYLSQSRYTERLVDIDFLIKAYEENAASMLFGKSKDDGFPITYILQGVAYILAASTGDNIKGKRVLGKYMDLVKKYRKERVKIKIPTRGTCLQVFNDKHSALIGYVNNQFNKTLIEKRVESKIFIREPKFEECIEL